MDDGGTNDWIIIGESLDTVFIITWRVVGYCLLESPECFGIGWLIIGNTLPFVGECIIQSFVALQISGRHVVSVED